MSTTSSKNKSKLPKCTTKPYHHGSLRQALLDAALGIIAEHGVSALTLRQVASRAGVSHAAPKRHFASVTDLFYAVAEDGYHKLHTHLLERVTKRPNATPSQLLAMLGVGYVEFATSQPSLFRAMFYSAIDDRANAYPVEAAAGPVFDMLVSAVERGQEAGEVRQQPARDLALCAWSLVHGLSVLAVERQLTNRGFFSEDPVKLAHEVVQQLYLGLRP